MTEKLLPCPFCGGAKLEVSNKTTTISYVRKRHVAVYCKKCNTYGPRIIADETGYPEFCTEEAKQEAIAAWNRRAETELTRCEKCDYWDKSASFMSAHACAFWSSGKKTRYTENYDFCSFAERKEEHNETD